jgi:hypothetical protein
MENTGEDFSWILNERLTGQYLGDYCLVKTSRPDVINPDGYSERMALLHYDDDKLTFNGKFINVGDDLIEYLSTMEEIAEVGHSEPDPDSEGCHD